MASHFREWLAAIGGGIDEDDEGGQTMDAPPGYVWQATGGTICCAFRSVADLERDARQGLRRCTAAESAEFEQSRDEPWTASADAPEVIPGYRR